MAEHELVPRRYSEKEVARLLRRATELQRTESSVPGSGGLTLAELEEVVAEAGIDPRYLRRAAAELQAGPPGEFWARVVGSPIAFVLERTVKGEFPESEFEELVPLISSATLGQGNASAVGKTLTWSSRSDTNTSSQQVLITSRHGETAIRIEERLGGLAGGLFGGFLGGVGGGLGLGLGGALGGVLGSAALAVAFPIAALGGSYLAAREIFAAQVRKHRRRMERLLEEIVERVRSEVRHAEPEARAGGRELEARAGRGEL
ncbi:MAG: hypothetical protein ACE5HP_12470, partial [Gemmatimonadota bacterium]